MKEQIISVTYKVGAEKRELLDRILGGRARLVYLFDLPAQEREQALSASSVLLSWNIRGELRPEEYDKIKRAQLMQLISAGADHVPFDKLPDALIIAGNAGAYAEPMAEHVLAMTLTLAKHICLRHHELVRGIFDQAALNRMLRGSCAGILGFGGIGKAVARLLGPFGVNIFAVNTSGRTEEPVEFIGTLKDLEYILSSSNIVVISLPLTKKTRGLIGRRELELMKSDAILINVARGDILDEAALYEHLKSHTDFMAGIDAWWHEPLGYGEFRVSYPFFDLPNILGSPHNSALVYGSTLEATRLAAENIKKFLHGLPIANIVRREEYETAVEPAP